MRKHDLANKKTTTKTNTNTMTITKTKAMAMKNTFGEHSKRGIFKTFREHLQMAILEKF